MRHSIELEEKIQYLQELNKIVKPLKREIRNKKIKLFFQQKLLYITLRTVFVSILLTITSLLTFYYLTPQEVNAVESLIEKEIEYVYLPDSLKTMDRFLEEISKVESNNNYKIINQFGYMGKYQIGHSALKTIGINISTKDFIETPQLQEAAMLLLLKYNKNTLANYIGKYQHTTVNGIYITESGLLAAAHLGGCNSVKKFLDSNGVEVFKDGNGVPITRYMVKFNGFKIEL